MKKIIWILAFIFTTSLAYSQGTVRGKVLDGDTGEPVMFGAVSIDGTTDGTETDLDGEFELSLAAGTYSLTISYVGLTDYKITDLVIADGEIKNLGTLEMNSGDIKMDVIVIEAEKIENSENALLTDQRKAPGIINSISSQTFTRVGDGDAAAAIKRVTGVSIEGGKHVYVRGLGDRYTKTLMNGMSIPGLDPDKNSVQMDIFPTNLLDNIKVFKTFTPDLPGDFTGGTVDIKTKDFPEEETFNIGISIGYNPSMHFQDGFLTHQGDSRDAFGFGAGYRALPFSQSTDVPAEQLARDNASLGSQLNSLTSSLNPQMAAETTTNFLNSSYSLSYGNRIKMDNITWGYTLAANYANSSQHFDDALVGQYIKREAADEFNLDVARLDDQIFSDQNILWSALASTALKVRSHKFKLGVFHSQNGLSRSSRFTTFNGDENPAILERTSLEYFQRGVTNSYLGGEHSFGKKGNFKMDWTFSPTFSSIEEPDLRYTAYEIDDVTGEYVLALAVGAEAARVFRQLEETNFSSRMDMTYKMKKDIKLKFGFSNVYKLRDYQILDYALNFNGSRSLTGNPDEFLSDGNIWDMENTLGTTYLIGNFQPANSYSARQNTNGIYLMNEIPVGKLKFIYGLRVEQFQNWYTGQNAQGTVAFNDQKVIDEWDIMPSFNLVYGIVEDKMNLRTSYSRTVARPSFREVSVAQIQDRLSGIDFYGNIDVTTSDINNFDIRWEYYPNPGEVFSVNPFLKLFKDPIEMNAWQDGTFYRSDIVTPDNGGDAVLYGVELELRKNLDFISASLSGLGIGTNISFVQSRVKMDDDEFGVRQTWAREGETVDDFRPLAGQAPYLINTYLNYSSENSTTEANLSYNVQGKRLMVIGLGEVPDLYELPFHSLNFKVSHKFGNADRWKGSFSVRNILNQDRRNAYESFGISDTIARQVSPGISFSLGISFKII